MKYIIGIFLLVFYIHVSFGQDSLNMERLGVWNPPNMPTKSGVKFNDIWGYTAEDGSEYAIIGNVDSIMVVNVTDPYNPTRQFSYDGGNSAVWRDFKTLGDYAFGVCDGCSEGLHVFDLGPLPANQIQHVLTTNTFFNRAHNIYIDTTSQRLYAAGTDLLEKGLVVLDISTPNNPTLLANIEFDDYLGQTVHTYVHDVYVKSDTAYCSHGNLGFYIWDMTDLTNVTYLDHFNSPGYNHSSWLDTSGQYAYYAEEIPEGRPLAIVNLTSITNITVDSLFKDPISGIDEDVIPHNPFVKDDFLYISYYEDGLKVYNISDPANPQLYSYYDSYPQNGSTYGGMDGMWGTYPFFDSGNIISSDVVNGLQITKIQTCSNPITFYRDRDGDGYGDPDRMVQSCSVPGGYVLNNMDCDDTDGSGIAGNTYYLDFDNDGFGNPNITVEACALPLGYSELNTDCDDTNNMVNPEYPEICDNIDNNCNNLIDTDDPFLTTIDWYEDNDDDGFGTNNDIINQCEQPRGFAAFNGDCDDNNANAFPGNIEVCDGDDNNCDGIIDEGCLEDCDDLNLIINVIAQNDYRAKQTILSQDVTITDDEDISFYAGQTIELDSDFEVLLGANFQAIIQDCELTTTTLKIGQGNMNQLISYLESGNNIIDFSESVVSSEKDNYLLIKNNDHLLRYLKMNYFSKSNLLLGGK